MDKNKICIHKKTLYIFLLIIIIFSGLIVLNKLNQQKKSYQSRASDILSCPDGQPVRPGGDICWYNNEGQCWMSRCDLLTPTPTPLPTPLYWCREGQLIPGTSSLYYHINQRGECIVVPYSYIMSLTPTFAPSLIPTPICKEGCPGNVAIGQCAKNQYGNNIGKKCVCKNSVSLYINDLTACPPDNTCKGRLCPDRKTLINNCQKNEEGKNTGYFCGCPTTNAITRPNRLELTSNYDLCPVEDCGGIPSQKCADGSYVGACSKDKNTGRYNGLICTCDRGYSYPTLENAELLYGNNACLDGAPTQIINQIPWSTITPTSKR